MKTDIYEMAKSFNSKNLYQRKLAEAFTYNSDERQLKIAQKIANVLLNSIGKSTHLCKLAYPFQRAEALIGYFGIVKGSNDPSAIRINFEIHGDTSKVHSIDIYQGVADIEEPLSTLHITDPTLNIVQILKQAAGQLLDTEIGIRENRYSYSTKNRAHHSKRLKEAAIKDAMLDYLSQGGSPKYSDWVRYATSEGFSISNPTHFRSVTKEYEAGEGSMTSAGTNQGFQISPAEPEEPLWSEEDALIFEDNEEQEALEAFQEAVAYTAQMSRTPIGQGYDFLFIYGSPGVGKSYRVEQTLEAEKANLSKNNMEVRTVTGGIAGYTGLLTMLYEHREGFLIILDDNDNIIDGKNQTASNILKGAMQTDPRTRRVQLAVGDKKALFGKGGAEEPEDTPEGLYDEADAEIFEESLNTAYRIQSRGKNIIFEKASGLHQIREAEAASEDSPRDFMFKSKMIIISNLMGIPEALEDRCHNIGMLFTFEQVAAIIDDALEYIDIPGIDMPTRQKVFDFITRNKKGIQHKATRAGSGDLVLTFRKFAKACLAYQSAINEGLGETTAFKWCYKQLYKKQKR